MALYMWKLLLPGFILLHCTNADNWQKPIIIQEPQNTVVAKDTRIELRCDTTGTPHPTVSWYKDRTSVKLIDNEVIQMPDDSLVIVKSDLRRDAGIYQCIATNKYDRVFSKKVSVNIEYLEDSFRENPKPENTTILSFVELSCSPPSGYPEPTVIWLKNGNPLKMRKDIVISVDQGKSFMRIGKVLYSDRGLYACSASNSGGTRKSSKAELTVTIPPPRLYDSTPLLRIYVGETGSLYCQSMFEPQPKRKWEKLDGKTWRVVTVDSRISMDPKGLLVIRNLLEYDSGSYRCTASNQAGQVQRVMNLKVFPKVAFTVKPFDKTVAVGDNVTFECQYSGGWSPTHWWLWEKDRERRKIFNYSTWNPRAKLDGTNLVVSNVKKEDDGLKVTCTVKDHRSTYPAAASLKVIENSALLPVLKLSPLNLTVNVGEDIVITCDVSNNIDTPTVSWEMASGRDEIKPGVYGYKFERDGDVHKLIIKDATGQESDVYRCIATNKAGRSTKEMQVTVQAGPDQAPSQVSDPQVTEILATSVRLKWTRPYTHYRAPLTGYVVTIIDVTGVKETKTFVDANATSRLITKLSPSTSYRFSIEAQNKNGYGPKSETRLVVTKKSTYTSPRPAISDKVPGNLDDVVLSLKVEKTTSDSIQVSWNVNKADLARISNFTLAYQKKGVTSVRQTAVINDKTQSTYELTNLDPDTAYEITLQAMNPSHTSPVSKPLTMATKKRVLIGPPLKITFTKKDDRSMLIAWSPPKDVDKFPDINGYKVTCLVKSTREHIITVTVKKDQFEKRIYDLDPLETYLFYVVARTPNGVGEPTKEYPFLLVALQKNRKIYGSYIPPPFTQPPITDAPTTIAPVKTGGIMGIIKEPWFIATVGVVVWVILLVIVIYLCCRRSKKRRQRDIYNQRGPLLDSRRSYDYPNTSLNRTRGTMRDTGFAWNGAPVNEEANNTNKSTMKSCCKSQASSVEDDFPNRADIKPILPLYHETLEMRLKNSNADIPRPAKDTNIRLAKENGYHRDVPLNNELNNRYLKEINPYSGERMYDSGDERPRLKIQGAFDQGSAPSSGSITRREKTKTDSAERRANEIVRTAAKKSFPDAELVNVMENNPQASWKREKTKGSPKGTRQPGEDTLRRRREGKSPFKPLPKLEVLNWADGLPEPPAPSTVASETGSPKMSSSASMFSENLDGRTDSRMSHGGSSSSLNKLEEKSSRPPTRRLSNASSMMSSELYQSEMDPSAYSDHVSERRRKKEKAVPPPIDLDGLTSDILLQWAESVTNSSPSSSGSSSPSALSAISSDGSFYTDEDFAQAVATVVECGGFNNFDYDYSLPGMPGSQPPVASYRNDKMNKIDEVLAKSKSRNSPAVAAPNKFKYDPAAPPTYPLVTPISFTNYLPGATKTGSLHNAPSGIPRSKHRGGAHSEKNLSRYGTGLQDVGTALGSATNPHQPSALTMSNLKQHDSSLDRVKKQPLTMSNLRHHENSLDRERKSHRPAGKIPSHLIDRKSNRHKDNEIPASNLVSKVPKYNGETFEALPETPLSVTSALERNESINSKDSVNSSNHQDSELEGGQNTTEHKKKKKKNREGGQSLERASSTSTASTVRTSPELEDPDATEC